METRTETSESKTRLATYKKGTYKILRGTKGKKKKGASGDTIPEGTQAPRMRVCFLGSPKGADESILYGSRTSGAIIIIIPTD